MAIKIGVTLPTMEPGLNRDILYRWIRKLDEGPFSLISCGERITYGTYDLIPVLSACAAWSTRINIGTAVAIAPLHDPVHLAKQLATVDALCEGRLIAGLGIGTRPDDFEAVGRDPALMKQKELTRIVGIMKSVWAGDFRPAGAPHVVGPAPVQPGGPRLRSGAIGPKAIRAAADWAETVTGWSMNADIVEIERQFALVRQAWQDASRAEPPLVTGFWVALGTQAREQTADHIRRYFDFMETAALEGFASEAGFAGSAMELKALLNRIEDLGGTEVVLTTTTIDHEELDRLADIVG